MFSYLGKIDFIIFMFLSILQKNIIKIKWADIINPFKTKSKQFIQNTGNTFSFDDWYQANTLYCAVTFHILRVKSIIKIRT